MSLPASSEIESSRGRWGAAALVAILGLATFLRLHDIDTLDVWVDEANGILTAKESLAGLVQRLRLDSSPPGYYVGLHLWMLAFGDGAVVVRLPSVLAGIALVIATWWVGRDLISNRVGLWAALFVAVSPIQTFYSQQARMYALLPLLGLLSVAFLVRYLERAQKRDFALWLAATLLALYVHNFAVYLLPVHGLLITLSGRLVSDLRYWLAAAALLALGFGPWLPVFVEQLGNSDHYAWLVVHWERWGPGTLVLNTFRSYSPAAEFVWYGALGSSPWAGWTVFGVVALAGFGAHWLWRSRRERGLVAASWPLALLGVPILASLTVSALATPNYVPGRVDQMMLPAFALLVGAGLAALRPAPLRALLTLALVTIGVWSKLVLYPEAGANGVAGGDRELARRLGEQAGPEDVILFTSLTRASLEYYLRREGVEARLLSFPRDTALHLGSQNDARLLADARALDREAAAVLGLARSWVGDEGRLFLVRVRSKVNASLSPEAMGRRFGFREVGDLGRFHQSGMGLEVETRVYRPAALGRESVDPGSRRTPRSSSSTPKRVPEKGVAPVLQTGS